MKRIIKKFKVANGKKFLLNGYETDYSGSYKKEEADDILARLVAETARLQAALYADKQYSLLIIFQAMDAGGKDGAISHTLSGLNPEGCEVYSFKQPGPEELEHDFLWRHNKALPAFGMIGVHNRSHYENVLITKVHPELLLSEHLPGIKKASDAGKTFWDNRYESIRNFERHLAVNKTVIVKFFLHLSKDEQKKRFLKRIDDPEKNWKFSAADIYEREFWEDYSKAYEKAIQETATAQCPWYVLPADKKWFTRIAISQVILETLKNLDLKYPVLAEQEAEKMAEAKKELLKE